MGNGKDNHQGDAMKRGGESPPLVGMEYRIVRLGGNQAFTLVRRVRFPYAILCCIVSDLFGTLE